MESVVREILNALRSQGSLSPSQLDGIIRKRSKLAHDGRRIFAKKRILPYYLEVRSNDRELFASWNVDDDLDALFIRTMTMKPRRTASGVATITVITKPWPCAGSCIYCPNDIRMPKSYLHDEPACQRAERNFFDPYLQVASRLNALTHMGHATDKVELIILGGSWTDYPRSYRTWFIHELFRALEDDQTTREEHVAQRRAQYEALGLSNDPDVLAEWCADVQAKIADGLLSYNEAYEILYAQQGAWDNAAHFQTASPEQLRQLHSTNEQGSHRVVGLVVETRPEALDASILRELRALGCTKIQMGIQSLDVHILEVNGRSQKSAAMVRAFELCRLFGFKTHVHFMLNLMGSTPSSDKQDYRTLATDSRYQPDEVKLYPCALVDATKLTEYFAQGLWRPYTEEELVDVLCEDMRATPSFTRVSRMIRDISAQDILVGNKKTNLRQMVEQKLAGEQAEINEIRFREIGVEGVDLDDLRLDELTYQTSATTEHFLQWITPEGKIAGFLRLSLPLAKALESYGDALPIRRDEAMIREVHVYGFAARIQGKSVSAQHHGLGKKLVERACQIAAENGYSSINVISAVGTRQYYRNLGFHDNGLYQQRKL